MGTIPRVKARSKADIAQLIKRHLSRWIRVKLIMINRSSETYLYAYIITLSTLAISETLRNTLLDRVECENQFSVQNACGG